MVSDIRLSSKTVDLIGDHVDMATSHGANPTLRFSPGEGLAVFGDGGQSGRLDLQDASGRVLASFAAGRPSDTGSERAQFDGTTGNLTLGGNGADGDVILNDSTGEARVWMSGSAQPKPDKARVYLDGRRAQAELGGDGADGDLVLRRGDGRLAIGLNAETAAGHFGAVGQEGDVLVYDARFEKAVHLDGKTGAVEARRAEISGIVSADAGIVTQGAITLKGDNGQTGATLSAEGGSGTLALGPGGSEVRGHGITIQQRISDTSSLVGKPRVFVGDMQWARATAGATDPEAGVRAMITTDGLCRLGGDGGAGALEVTNGDGHVGFRATDTRVSLGNRFAVDADSNVTLNDGIVSITPRNANDPGGVQIDQQAVRIQSGAASQGFVLMQNTAGLVTASLASETGVIEAQDVKLPTINSLLAKIDELETRLAALEAGA